MIRFSPDTNISTGCGSGLSIVTKQSNQNPSVFTHRSAQSFGFSSTVNGPFTQKRLENKGDNDIDSPEFHHNATKMMKRCWTALLLGVTAHSRQTS